MQGNGNQNQTNPTSGGNNNQNFDPYQNFQTNNYPNNFQNDNPATSQFDNLEQLYQSNSQINNNQIPESFTNFDYQNSPQNPAGAVADVQNNLNANFQNEQIPAIENIDESYLIPSPINPALETIEKPAKSNKLFFIISGIISVILIITIAILGFLISKGTLGGSTSGTGNSSSSLSTQSSLSQSASENNEGNNNVNNNGSNSMMVKSENFQNSTQNQNATSVSSQTPAQLAYKKNETSLSAAFLKEYFSANLDASGKCNEMTICGENADPDIDGLDNLNEQNTLSNPINKDSNGDGISDGDSILIYSINPLLKDSDLDGRDDLLEILACSDPAIKTGTNFTMNKVKRDLIEENVKKNKLHEPTISTFTNAGAKSADLTKGLLDASCNISSVVL